MKFLGETAALSTAVMWSFGSLLFTEAARRSGAFALNQFRITLALLFLAIILALTGMIRVVPHMPPGGVGWLAVSGLIGLAIGDLGYFGAYKRLGARLGTLMMALVPPMTTVIAIIFLDERLGIMALIGMALTIAGITWVVMERGDVPIPRGHRVQGVVLGAFGSLCQAIGLVFGKRGMALGIDPLPANAVRMAAATAGIWIIAAATRQVSAPRLVWQDRTARWSAVGATLFGPTFGVWLSLVAAANTKTGIAATLMSLTPIFIIPLVAIIHREKVSPRAVFGALVAVAGVAVIFMR